jgi:site-specific DNA-methyltransferase (adenine-specific)
VTPYYEQDGIVIWCGDCREVLPTIHRADAVITDPPFGIDWSRATWGDDSEQYLALMAWLVSECQRLVKNGWCFVFQSMTNVGRFHEWFPDGWRIYAACKNFAQIRPTGVFHSWDPVVFWKYGEVPRNTCVNRDYFVGNVAGLLGKRVEHPCPKPEDTMRHIVAISSEHDALIVDPFMGSGTTLVAAKRLGRKAIGIEMEEKYCEIAAKRLAQGALDLFGEASA